MSDNYEPQQDIEATNYEVPDEGAIIVSQIVVTQGIDSDGDPQIWCSYPQGVALHELLGALEVAKAHLVMQAYA